VGGLGICWCRGGPETVRVRKVKNGQVTPDGPKMGVKKLHPPKLDPSGVTCPWAQNGGCNLHPPSGPIWGQLPILSFWAMGRLLGLGRGWAMAPRRRVRVKEGSAMLNGFEMILKRSAV